MAEVEETKTMDLDLPVEARLIAIKNVWRSQFFVWENPMNLETEQDLDQGKRQML